MKITIFDLFLAIISDVVLGSRHVKTENVLLVLFFEVFRNAHLFTRDCSKNTIRTVTIVKTRTWELVPPRHLSRTRRKPGKPPRYSVLDGRRENSEFSQIWPISGDF